jgi:hypothetical protein
MSSDEEAFFELLEKKYGFSLKPTIRRCTITDAVDTNSYTVKYPDDTERDEVECVAGVVPQIGYAVKVEQLDGYPTIVDVIGHGPIREQNGTSANANTGSATFVSSGLSSDLITLPLIKNQIVKVTVTAKMSHTADFGHGAVMSYKVTGATTYGPNDDDGIEQDNVGNATCSRSTFFTAGATGSHTFTLQYRALSGLTANFYQREIMVEE